MSRSHVLTLALLGLLGGMSRSQDATKLPSGPAPQFLPISKFDPQSETATVIETRSVPVVEKLTREVIVGGMVQKQVVEVTRYVTQQRASLHTFKGAEFGTAGGEKLTRKAALEKLTSGTIVLVSADGNKIDPGYLRLFKSETLVIVIPPTPR